MSDPTFAVPDAVLDDLRARLQNTRWPSVVKGQGWARGTDLDYLRPLVEYWRTGFDWRAQENALSRFTHERVQVSGLSLHQIHERAADPNALPVVLLHGWPDSFLRYIKALPLVATTAAVGLADSPAGLASWIVEKLRSWSDCDGQLERRFSRDEVLTWVTLYWVTNTIGSSFLPYVEYDSGPDDKVTVPTGVTIFPKDLVSAPRVFAERFFPIVRWTELPVGGHFTAWEEPEAFARELAALAQEVNKC
jgi:pimeloyl-ACP methyl ester carboxylesterase